MERPLIPYLKCMKTNAKIAGLDISDFFKVAISNPKLSSSNCSTKHLQNEENFHYQ